MRYPLAFFLGWFCSAPLLADGIDCADLPQWSEPLSGYQLNLHHVFCGEPGRKGRAKGLHAMPQGEPPSTYLSATPASRPNAAGVYELRQIRLRFAGREYLKGFSTLFPDHCSRAQVERSAVHALVHNHGHCAAVGWALCGPGAPDSGERSAYCLGADGNPFEIATAPLQSSPRRINTAFPIYRP